MLVDDQTFAYAFFRDETAAADAVHKLVESGFETEHIGALMLGEAGVEALPVRHKTGIVPGALIGAALGAAIGAVALPAAGLVAIGSVFGAAASGGVAGTLAGSLGGLGLWKDEVDFPRSAFERGDVLVGALTSQERSEQARAALRAAGAAETKLATRRTAQQELTEQRART